MMETMFERQGETKDGKQELMFLLYGRMVERFHTVPMLKGVTLAQHQFGVAWLCWLLTQGACRTALLMAALSHDMAEQLWGDMPAPAKRLLNADDQFSNAERATLQENSMFFELNEQEKCIMKIADYMEGMLSCVHERRLGNRYVEIVYQSRFRQYVIDYQETFEPRLTLLQIERVQQMFNALDELWKETLAPYNPEKLQVQELKLPRIAGVCIWCGHSYHAHEDEREGRPVPKTPCLGLKSSFLPK